jgi:hypothetical protein
MRPRALAAATALAAGLAVPGSGQVVELVPFAGFRFGGSLSAPGERGLLEVKESAAWGATLDVEVADDGEIEASFARQNTRLATGGVFTSQPRFDLAVETYQIGGNYVFGEYKARFRPYLGMTVGLTRLVPQPAGLESETRFSGTFGVGVKAYVSRRVGLRLEARGLLTVLRSDGSIFCGSLSGCEISSSGATFGQGELRGGLMFRF